MGAHVNAQLIPPESPGAPGCQSILGKPAGVVPLAGGGIADGLPTISPSPSSFAESEIPPEGWVLDFLAQVTLCAWQLQMPRRLTHLSEVKSLARHALGLGGVLVSPFVVRWNVAGQCDDPIGFEIEGTKSHEYHVVRTDPWGDQALRRAVTPGGQGWRSWTTPEGETFETWERGDRMTVEMQVRCRKCGPCLRYRAWSWRTRAEAEIQQANRSWFFTLTLSPEEQLKAKYRAELQPHRKKIVDGVEKKYVTVPWHELSETEQFKRLCDAIGPEVQLWLKRVRKQSGAKLRFLLVAEAHKSGLPHFHGLLHEVTGEQATKRLLQGQWLLGFSQFKLVEDSPAAAYVCKYLSKSLAARVRASLRYGNIRDNG